MKFTSILMTLVTLIGCATPKMMDAHIRSHTFLLVGGPHACTGVQVQAPSGKSYVVSAGHCVSAFDQKGEASAVIAGADKPEKIKLLEISKDADVLIATGVSNLTGLRIAANVEKFEHIRLFGHGNLFDTVKRDGELIQDAFLNLNEKKDDVDVADENMCVFMKTFSLPGAVGWKMCQRSIITSAPADPGMSGGPAVNDNNELVGIISCTDQPHYSYIAPGSEVSKLLKDR